MGEVWILGAAGRCGRAITAQLARAQLLPVLVGRDGMALRNLAATIGDDARVVTVNSIAQIVDEIARNRPAVVVNTIGPFARTAVPLAQACLSGTHYVDLSNEVTSIIAVLGLNARAAACGSTLVSGAGFGVLASESLVFTLCEGERPVRSVRVDVIPMVRPERCRIGSSRAASLLDSLALGGLAFEKDALEPVKLFSALEQITLPDGTCVETGAVAAGDLEAARRASGASCAIAASSRIPTVALVRTLAPAAVKLLRISILRRLATDLLARWPACTDSPGRDFSWVRARLAWDTGEVRQAWLRSGDAMAFTAAAAAEVAIRLAREPARAGAFTPAALFGAELAIAAGGTFLLTEDVVPCPSGLPVPEFARG